MHTVAPLKPTRYTVIGRVGPGTLKPSFLWQPLDSEEMKRAIWLWGEEEAKEFLEEIASWPNSFFHWVAWAGFTWLYWIWIRFVPGILGLGAEQSPVWSELSVATVYHQDISLHPLLVSRSCRFNESWPWQFWNCLKYSYLFACCCDLIHYMRDDAGDFNARFAPLQATTSTCTYARYTCVIFCFHMERYIDTVVSSFIAIAWQTCVCIILTLSLMCAWVRVPSRGN